MTSSHLPLASLIIPCRNEGKTIRQVIDSLLEQDYPGDRLEILFVDGMSTDGTREAVRDASMNEERFVHRASGAPAIRLLNNPERTTPVAFNIGISAARGDVIFTMGAHTRYSPNYVSGAVATMMESDADAVGSVAVTEPGRDTRVGRAIARALATRFGVGDSLMRVGVTAPREADTASCPGYRRSAFKRAGRFNPRLVRNQDIEFNLRLRRAGGLIIVDPRIRSFYRARGRLRDLARNCFANGYWVIRGLRLSRMPFSPRHLVPLAFVGALTGSAAAAFLWPPAALIAALTGTAYALTAGWFALRATGPDRALLPVVFAAMHASYGLGSLWALLTLWWPGSSPFAGRHSQIVREMMTNGR
jgi:glycosyltransferase involved in cell wall biosynthesis